MTDAVLFDSIDGFIAYRGGATDSGISDPALEARVVNHLRDMSDDDFRRTCARFAAAYLTEARIESGYGLPEVRNFIEWLDDKGIAF